jgi:hypothetical protein
MSAHGATSSRMLSSIPTNAGMVAGVLRLLARLDDLPWGATAQQILRPCSKIRP